MNDPHDPIIARLRRPREEPRSIRRSASGVTAITGGHVPARPDTIRFVRERFVGDHGLLAVEYEDEDDRSWFTVFGVTRSSADQDWRMTGAAGGGRSEPQRPVPWANLGGWWNDRVACVGGPVHGDQVRKVRLVAAGGEVAEDDIGESSIALVIAFGRFHQPWSVELYDEAGGLVRTHQFRGDGSS